MANSASEVRLVQDRVSTYRTATSKRYVKYMYVSCLRCAVLVQYMVLCFTFPQLLQVVRTLAATHYHYTAATRANTVLSVYHHNVIVLR